MSLLASLLTSAGALSVYDRAVAVAQNNVANASTPGYASQSLSLNALPFDPGAGLLGGLRAGSVESSRNQFAEAAVRRQQESLGTAAQQSTSLDTVQSALDLSSASGIPAALGNLFASFSAWSLNPAGGPSRQAVIDSASQVADSFHTAASKLEQAGSDMERQIGQTAGQINALAAQLRDYNVQRRTGERDDASLDAKIQNTLENLSQLTNFTSTVEADGTVTVLAGGQTPLVIGDHQYTIADRIAAPASLPPGNPGVPPTATILDSAGRDVTAQFTAGSLGALLDMHNRVLASFLGDGAQPGELNRLAQTLADRVNSILTSGNISDGPPPQPGAPLFTYDTGNATRAAATLALDPAITADQLAAIDPGPPYAGNGTALNLAALANPQNAADQIDNVSYVDFYGNLAAGVGRQLSQANDQQDIQKQLVAQAQSLRQQISGVSLDEQAVRLIEFQRAYQANAKLVTVLSELTQTAINLLP
jgi:flagellar hook-associated protein 1 FlgK